MRWDLVQKIIKSVGNTCEFFKQRKITNRKWSWLLVERTKSCFASSALCSHTIKKERRFSQPDYYIKKHQCAKGSTLFLERKRMTLISTYFAWRHRPNSGKNEKFSPTDYFFVSNNHLSPLAFMVVKSGRETVVIMMICTNISPSFNLMLVCLEPKKAYIV